MVQPEPVDQPEPGPSTSQTLISKLDVGDPLYLHPSDSSALTIVSVKLKGTENYAVWSASMKLALEAKNKFGFVNGKCEKSTEDSVLASQWDRCNSVVLTWLLNSVSEELFLGQVFSSLASEVWEDLKETYDKIDGSVVYDLFKKINGISQNGSTVADYYNRLTTMWKQFDAMLQLPTCSCKAAKDYNDFNMLIKLMQFLMGLDDVYQPVRTNLLTRETFPSVKVAYSVVSREESHRLTSSGSKGQNVSFVSKPSQSFESKRKITNQRGPNPNLKCTHCNMIGHTIDRCFELIGYPPGFKKKPNSGSVKTNKSNAAIGSSTSMSSPGLPFTSEQIAKLLSLVGEKSGVESTSVGGESCFVNHCVSCSSSMFYGGVFSWIVDSGASQHMLNSDKDMFNIVDVSEFDIKVGHPNGTNVKVQKIGDVKLTNDIILKDVFYVPEYHVNYSNLSVENFCFINSLNKTVEPSSYFEAIKDPRWIEAMNSEMEALYRNNTWVVVDLPKGRKPIGCKWVYRIKYKANGEVERYKARLVAKGFNQREGIDFGETFSPVVKMVTVRVILKLAVNKGWPLYQLDINNAFLYGSLSEDVYMTLPQGYFDNDKNKVCKLVKSLYGLKQAPRKWNEKLTSVLLEMGFVKSLCDHSLFVLCKENVIVVLLVYVDDIVITGNSISEITHVKKSLSESFKIKDLGILKYFLGIEVLYSDEAICLSQRKYCLELLNEFGYLGCKPVNTPIEQSHVITSKTDKDNQFLENVNGFQKLIGKLIYLSLTRPDISYAVQFLSQFMHKPCQSHLDIALRLLRYLKQSPGKGVMFRKTDNFDISGYVDSDWGKCTVTRKSVTGFGIFLGDTLVSWKSKKQGIVSRSTAEAEYRAMCSAACEVMWIKNILSELKVFCTLPMRLFCDSKSAISISQNPVFHERTKHFELDLHFLREKIASSIIDPHKIASENQIADIFTKGLNTAQHDALCEKLGLFDMFANRIMRGC
ncbi:putative RNA-directed DNA polymerase [Helianthus annuus]|nr:putative RNA-directed DNA polymerase [Helianthus annuus]